MLEVENTTYSGIGKTFLGLYDAPAPVLKDWKGRRVFKGDEYYIFDVADCVVYVHIEEVRDYLDDYRLEVDCYDQLIQLIEVHHDNFPVIM